MYQSKSPSSSLTRSSKPGSGPPSRKNFFASETTSPDSPAIPNRPIRIALRRFRGRPSPLLDQRSPVSPSVSSSLHVYPSLESGRTTSRVYRASEGPATCWHPVSRRARPCPIRREVINTAPACIEPAGMTAPRFAARITREIGHGPRILDRLVSPGQLASRAWSSMLMRTCQPARPTVARIHRCDGLSWRTF